MPTVLYPHWLHAIAFLCVEYWSPSPLWGSTRTSLMWLASARGGYALTVIEAFILKYAPRVAGSVVERCVEETSGLDY